MEGKDTERPLNPELSTETETPSTEAQPEEAGLDKGLETQGPEESSPQVGPGETPAPDVDAIVAERVAATEAEWKARLEKLQSAKDREIVEERRRGAEEAIRRLEEAQRVAQQDPSRAWQIAEQELSSRTQQDLVRISHEEWGTYLVGRAEEEGLTVEDSEVQEILRGQLPELAKNAVVNPTAASSQAMSINNRLVQLGRAKREEKHKEEIKAAREEGEKAAMAQVDKIVEARIAQALEAAGIAPDSGGSSARAGRSDAPDYTKMTKAQRKAAVAQLREKELEELGIQT